MPSCRVTTSGPSCDRSIGAHRFVIERIAGVLEQNVPDVHCAGTSDLAIGDRKFSGNSLRCKRRNFLYHGTLLYDFPLDRIGQLLKMPARQPHYRQHRSHANFLTNLPLAAAALRQSLITAFDATEPTTTWPRGLTAELVAEKYSRAQWNERT